MKLRLAIGFYFAVAISAQTGRSYGPSHTWWDANSGSMLPWAEEYDNAAGQLRVFSENGAVRTEDHPFFNALGKNGRACITCHQPANAMSVAAATVRERWVDTGGKDPLFAPVDGANCPDQDPSLRDSHSLLLERGLFRIALPVPSNAEFRIEVVRDPAGCNTSPRYGLGSDRHEISVYRRPRMAANLGSLVSGPAGAVLMADGRERTLRSQAITAAIVHEEAGHPTVEQLKRILDFETQLLTAQFTDLRAGLLNEKDGPEMLGAERKTTLGPENEGWATFVNWTKPGGGVQQEQRRSVARGSKIFATREFLMRGERKTCAQCHASGTARWMEIGTTNVAGVDDASALPVFRLTCPDKVVYTSDPGRAMVSGKCSDIGAIVVPQFRGLAARAPYFVNGSAETLRDVVEFYDRRYGVGLSAAEKKDLENFLCVL